MDYNELVVLNGGQATTTSRQVAEVFGRKHKDVLEAIDNIQVDFDELAEKSADPNMFTEETYIHQQNHQTYRQVRMNRDGFVLLVSSFKGKKALQFKLRYIQAFNDMEHTIQTQAQLNGLLMFESEEDMRRERESKNKRNEAIWMNAITKQTRMYLDTAERVSDPELRQALINKAGRQLLAE
ncbi:MAG: Rha family transcriptional regulator [Weissella confusa]